MTFHSLQRKEGRKGEISWVMEKTAEIQFARKIQFASTRVPLVLSESFNQDASDVRATIKIELKPSINLSRSLQKDGGEKQKNNKIK